jgi:hypothetical protein
VLALRARGIVGSTPELARRLAARYEHVLGAVADLERNVGPQLALEALMARLRRT